MIPYGHQLITQEDIDAVVDVLKSDWLTTGPHIEKFERSLCEYTEAKFAVATNSATSALDIAVQALDLPHGSEVISTAFTFAATNNALLYNGLKPVFADIRRETRNIDPEDIRRKITRKTRAIMVVDFAGHPCDLKEIREIAEDHNLFLIEDAAHALGSSYNGKKIGTFADITVFSFHPVKPITTGEGGATVTEDSDLAEKMHLLRSHGIIKSKDTTENQETSWQYDMKMLGRNYRLTDIQAALGLSQIKKLDQFIRKRNSLALQYMKELEDVPFIELPVTKDQIGHGWHLFTVLVNGINRNHFYSHLRNYGIGANVHYIPTYRFSYYKEHQPNDFSKYPVTEDVFNRIITLPLYPGMADEDLWKVIDVIKAFELK
jgi:UDP-4-amino-4,6-dideoxy-N-acetyl-beta-L-altrosamine transaminase